MDGIGHVRLLPVHVANKIAAGEVVERPAAALKELIENALDAGATRIDAAVAAGGAKLISVRDNGCGMTREDALMALERQATSKITDVDDIDKIETLGFRGEAIPSIAAVSRFVLTTRRAESDEATRLVVNAGTLAEVATCGAPAGTQVDVRDLFCNVPARRKFLRAYTTEEAHIRAVFTAHALANPAVAFSLTSDASELYRLHEGDTLIERIRALFGAAWADTLLEVKHEAGDISVRGYVERPRLGEAVRHEQYIFVNRRPATAAPIAYALREAFPRTAGETRHGCVLFIELPPADVDVNVHPTKREVRFRRAAAVREALMEAFAAAVAANAPAVQQAQTPQIAAEPVQRMDEQRHFAVPFSTPAARAVQKEIPQPQQAQASIAGQQPERIETRTNLLWKRFAVVGALSSGYLLLETDSGLVTLNPQAARERIAYEKILATMTHAPAQNLLMPEMVRLSPAAAQQMRAFMDVFAAMGFAAEQFGQDVWKVDAVPLLMGERPAADVLPSILADIAEMGAKRGGARWREELVSKAVAGAYARFAPQMTPELATELVQELAACECPYVSPRGKPVMILTSVRELDRRFGKA